MISKTDEQPLFNFPTSKAADILRLYQFTAHSIKRGAIMTVLRKLPEGSPLLNTVPLLGKHAKHWMGVQDITVRYASEMLPIARHLGTGSLTCLL
ncbi:hypothetical protein AGDE_16988 [Angomonas deanei]|nr:hypothetical protein AGDE_16988 [Angomonas deanei]|eukprot:EPY15745.1 hypothetical protein AGDE_16988 [Angomonas deanei]